MTQRHRLRTAAQDKPLFPPEDAHWHQEAKEEAKRWYKDFKQKKRESQRTYMFPSKQAGTAGIVSVDAARPEKADLWQDLFEAESSRRQAIFSAEDQWRSKTVLQPRSEGLLVLRARDINAQKIFAKQKETLLPNLEQEQMMKRFALLEGEEQWFNKLTRSEGTQRMEIISRRTNKRAAARDTISRDLEATIAVEASKRYALMQAAQGWMDQLAGRQRAEHEIQEIRSATDSLVRLERHEDPQLRKELLEDSQATTIVTTQDGSWREDVFVSRGAYLKSKRRRLLGIEEHNRKTILLAQEKVFSEIFCQGHEQILTKLRRSAKQKRRAVIEDVKEELRMLQTLQEPSNRLRIESAALTHVRTLRGDFRRHLEVLRNKQEEEEERRRNDRGPGTALYYQLERDKYLKMEEHFRTQIETIVKKWMAEFREHCRAETAALYGIIGAEAEKEQELGRRRLVKLEVEEGRRRAELSRGEEKWRGHLRLSMSHERMFPPAPKGEVDVLVVDEQPPLDLAPIGLLEDEQGKYRSDIEKAESRWRHNLFVVQHEDEKQDILGTADPALVKQIDALEVHESEVRAEVERAERCWRQQLLEPTALRLKAMVGTKQI